MSNAESVSDHPLQSSLSGRMTALSQAILESISFKSKKVQPEVNPPPEESMPLDSSCKGRSQNPVDLSVLSVIPMAICVTDFSGVISYRNPEFNASIDIDYDTSNIFGAFPPFERNKVLENLRLAKSKVISSMVVTRQKTTLASGELSYSWTFACTPDRQAVVLTGKPLSNDPMGHLSMGECESFSNQLLQGQFHQDIGALGSSMSSGLGKNLSFTLKHFADKVQRKAEKTLSQKEREIRNQSQTETMEIKRMFVRHIGHEIRSPLNATLNGLQMLASQKEGLSEDALEIMADTEVACRTAVEILDDLLIYEKLDSDTLSLEQSHFDVIELAKQVKGLFRIQARDSDINLELNLPEALESIVVYADRTRIAQVYRSMVSDALKFTPRNGKVSVAVVLNEASGRVRFEVNDGGIGLTRARRVSLFQKPLNFDPNKLHADQGSGLGYFVSRGVVEKHGGVIGVSNGCHGVGTKFFVELNVVSKGNLRSFAPDETREIGSTPVESLPVKSLRLLVVDDVVSCRKFHKKLLAPFCSEIIEAGDGQEAVEIVAKILDEGKSLDGIVLDNAMPFMNGTVAAKRIREIGFHRKIIGVTGNAFDKDKKEFLLCGADEVIIKPVDQRRYESMARAFASR